LAKIKQVLKMSHGRPALALRLMQDEEFFQQYQVEIDKIQDLVFSNLASSLTLINKMLDKKSFNESREIVEGMIDSLGLVFHDILAEKFKTDLADDMVIHSSGIDRLSAKYTVEDLKRILIEMTEAKKNLQSNVEPKTVLQSLVINI
jgi:hypothetical protein